jgi:DNA polymerase elongation subunit (family B)
MEDKYKTTSIEDTELIYTILRENKPNNQIDIEYNYNTKEYILHLTDKEFHCDPKVPLNFTTKVIYGDTDSIFIEMAFNRNDIIENRKDTFKLAIECGDKITEMFNRPPINLEFEKIYGPFVLLTKKRYIGNKYEDVDNPMKIKEVTTSGIAITKRNYCNMVKKCYREIIDTTMNTSDLEYAINIYKSFVDKIDNYQISQEDLIISAQIGKEYSCSICKKKTEWIIKCKNKIRSKICNTLNPKMLSNCSNCNFKFECLHKFSLGHINLAQKFLYRNDEICVGDRIQYIFVESNNKDAAKSELTEDPSYAKNNGIKYNRGCYLEQLAKSILGFFKVVLQNEPDLIDDLLTFTNDKLVEFGSQKLKISDFKIIDD